MYKRILVPVDGSIPSNRGLAAAIGMARGQRARLCVLHVADERALALNPEVGGPYLDRLLNLQREVRTASVPVLLVRSRAGHR